MNNITKIIKKQQEEFHKMWDIIEPETCTRVKTHNTHTSDDYVPLEPTDVSDHIETTIRLILEDIARSGEERKQKNHVAVGRACNCSCCGHLIDDILAPIQEVLKDEEK